MGDLCPHCGREMPPDECALGNLIRAQRISMRLSLRDVERISEGTISNAYLSQIETGKIKDPSASMVLRISAALSLDLEKMLCAIDPLRLPAGGFDELRRIA
jgi:transcriptional regulator with XRE-family HTH domain